jgi:serine protease Do
LKNRNLMNRATLDSIRHPFAAALLAATLFVAPLALAQRAPGRPARDDSATGFKENPRVLAAFHDAVAGPSKSVVRVRADNKDVALGTVISADGLLLTKNSELVAGATPWVVFRDGRTLPATVVNFDDRYDLALLKVDAKDLTPIQWGDAKAAYVGELLASPGVGEQAAAVGVLSVAARSVRARDLMVPPPPENAGYLGVALDEAEGGARVMNVMINSAAQKAGIKVNDIVTLIGETPIIDSETMVNTIQHHRPGDDLPIKVKRDGQELELRATLDKRPSDPGLKRSDYQNHLGSDLSNRRSGFPQVLQHDMVIRPRDCGGPVVDLDGKALGINVARAGRVESYAIPAEAVKTLIEKLKSPMTSTTSSTRSSPGQATRTAETRTRAAAEVPK